MQQRGRSPVRPNTHLGEQFPLFYGMQREMLSSRVNTQQERTVPAVPRKTAWTRKTIRRMKRPPESDALRRSLYISDQKL